MKESLVSKDQAWMDRLHHFSEIPRLITHVEINIRATMESIWKRQCEMTKKQIQKSSTRL